ncbi:MAG: diacylglycerol kinase family protein [Flavobacteriales bacterium]|nr:diacylglycerol kinase family protein [Flavobacteriales bacterium]MCX7769111.1 diacylglycerol kinase family protein [Flavobacteriales bacterium]MDW8409855.1 diacylglycerol kinase family protein [Flavobacteriales bacterium]
MKALRRFLWGFEVAIRGFLWALRTQRHLQIHLLALTVVTASGLFFRLSPGEWLAVALASGFVIGTELLNTAVEELCNHLWPHPHPLAARIKDVAAAAVLFAALTALVVGMIIFGPRLVSM